MTWTSEEVYAKDLQPGDRFTSRWQGDHSVAMQEACTVVTTGYRPLGGLSLEIKMPSGDHATRVFNAGNRVFRWTESSEASEVKVPRFTLTDEKDPDHPGILDAERPDMVAKFGKGEILIAGDGLRMLNAGNNVGLDWTPRTTGEPEVAAAVKGLGPTIDIHHDVATPYPAVDYRKWAKMLDEGDVNDEAYAAEMAATFLPKETTDRILGPSDEDWWPDQARHMASAYAAEASEDAEDDFPTEIEKLKALELHLGIRDFHDDKILELRRELRAMWGDD